jgi:hypothetical protein
MVVDAAKHPDLARADVALAKAQGHGDEILARYGVRSPEALQAATDAPGRYRAGATYEKPTPGKAGVPSQALLRQRAYVARLQALYDRSEQKIMADTKNPNHQAYLLGPSHGGMESPIMARLGGGLSVAKDELKRLEDAAARRQKPTGIVGGKTARPGRGHVSYASTEKRQPTSAAAASPGPVVGVTKPPITSHANTGYNIEHGKVPENVTTGASRHFKAITRFVNTTERRNAAIATGSDVRRSARDVLVKVPGEDHGKLSHEIQEALGKEKPTIDELHGLQAALEAFREDMVPGLADNFSGDARHPVGTSARMPQSRSGSKAPNGYKWVDRNALGDLAKPAAGPRGRIARDADNVNSAVTAATVYFKIGHVGTRVFTNAATNIIQGSAKPLEIAKSVELWKQLDHEDRFERSPPPASTASTRCRTKAPAHLEGGDEGRLSGGRNTPTRRSGSTASPTRPARPDSTRRRSSGDARQARAPHDHNMNAAQAAKVDWVAKRANREGIAYDRLSNAEKRFIARAVWFYPWMRGTVGFAFNTITEHPFKSAVLGAAGSEGRQAQQKELGDLPGLRGGLFKLAGGSRPLVADFSTFSPFATPPTSPTRSHGPASSPGS